MLVQKSYITVKALLIILLIKIIYKSKFMVVVLNLEDETVIIYIVFFLELIEVYSF